jgi:hypothetical protein
MLNLKKAAGVLAGASLLALSVATAAGASTATVKPHVTAACGVNCFSLSTLLTGRHTVQNAYIPGGNGLAVTGKVGQKLNMKLGNDSYRQEDFTDNTPGLTVSDFCAPAGTLPSGQQFASTSYQCLHYAGFPVFESNWSPDGDESGLCVGVAVANLANQNVTLQNCGETTRTLWIADLANSHLGATPWVNGSSANFSHALSLTEQVGSKSPQNQLFVQHMNLLTGGFVDNSQMFRVAFGPFV